jgi:hypothetical protein
MIRVVLTGGGLGGKSTLGRELITGTYLSRRWVVVPEIADVILQSGISAANQEFEVALVSLQIATEEVLGTLGKATDVLLCHRGSLDPLAFWLRKGWSEDDFFARTATSRQRHYDRYHAVIHLESTAIGASEVYKASPRAEPIEQAKLLDLLCERAWGGHPHYGKVQNSSGIWAEKKEKALNLLAKSLSMPAGERFQVRRGNECL